MYAVMCSLGVDSSALRRRAQARRRPPPPPPPPASACAPLSPPALHNSRELPAVKFLLFP